MDDAYPDAAHLCNGEVAVEIFSDCLKAVIAREDIFLTVFSACHTRKVLFDEETDAAGIVEFEESPPT